MPNWTTNTLVINRNAAAKYIADGKFDFNKIIPMPDIYTTENVAAPYGPSHSGSSTDETVIIYLTDGFAHELDDETMKLAIVSVDEWSRYNMLELVIRAKALYASCKSSSERKALVESGRLRVYAVQRYGDPDWYSWAKHHWGTKWNADDTYVEDADGKMVTIHFSTAWSYPSGIVAALAQRESGWSWEFYDEDYTGRYVITPDHLKPELIPGTEQEEEEDEIN